jgi:hypothetical protein
MQFVLIVSDGVSYFHLALFLSLYQITYMLAPDPNRNLGSNNAW